MKRTLVWCLLVILLCGAACQPSPAANASVPQAQPKAAEVSAPMAMETPSAAATVADESNASVPKGAEATHAIPETTGNESRFAPLYAEMVESAVLPEMIALPANMVTDFYGIDLADCTDGIYYISFDNLLADEIVLVDAVDAPAAKRIEQALRTRLDVKAKEAEDYSPDQYAVIQKCKVLKKDLTVAMLVSPEAETLTALFDAFC